MAITVSKAPQDSAAKTAGPADLSGAPTYDGKGHWSFEGPYRKEHEPMYEATRQIMNELMEVDKWSLSK